MSAAASMLLEIIGSKSIRTLLETRKGFRFYDTSLKQDIFFLGGAFRGSFEHNGIITATNIVSPEITEKFDTALNLPKGTSILHEALEGYLGAKYFPGSRGAVGLSAATARNDAYIFAHGEAACTDPRYRDIPSSMGLDKKAISDFSTKRIIQDTVSIYDVNTGKTIYDFGTYKY